MHNIFRSEEHYDYGHGYGLEFRINNNLFYPGYLPKSDLITLSRVLIDEGLADNSSSYEIQIRRNTYHKGIEWEIKSFYLEKKTLNLFRIYTFSIDPNWRINFLHEHWTIPSYTHTRCEKLTISNKIQSAIYDFQLSIAEKYKNTFVHPYNDRFLSDDKWVVILANDERGIKISQDWV